jgi:tRNA uridine 5-carboxymethylaminomethyl modification enzyme
VEIQAKYAGYIDRQQEDIDKSLRYENMKIPTTFSFKNISGISIEIQQKLSEARPETLGMASRISGVTPAAISLLLIHLRG